MFKRLGFIVAAAMLLFAPVVQAAPPPPLEAYGALPSVDMVALAPSGDHYAIATDVGGKRHLLVLDLAGKTLAAVVIGDEKIRDVSWAGDDRVLITTSRTYDLRLTYRFQYEISQVVVFNFRTNKLTGVLSSGPAQNGVWGEYGVHEIDGRWYGWFGGMTMEGDHLATGHPDLYKVDLDTGRGTRIAKGGQDRLTRSWLVGGAGQVLARSDYNDNGVWRLFVGDAKVLDAKDPFSDNYIVGQGRTAGSLIYARPSEDGRDLFEVTPGGKPEGEPLFAEEKDIGLLFDPWSALAIGTYKDEDRPVYNFFSASHTARARAVEKVFAGKRGRLVSWSRDFSRAIAFTDGGDDSGTYWLVNFTTSQVQAIGNVHPDVPPEAVGAVSVVSYKAADGLAIEGVLTLPPGSDGKGLPLVLLPHGGPRAHDTVSFDWMAQAFASRGYAVLQPNFRGSTGYGQAFIDAGKGEFGGKMQTDMADGVAFLAAQGVIDPKRVCIVGASYGGYAALAGVTLYQGLYRCAVAYGGVFDVAAITTYDGDRQGEDSRRFWKSYIGERRIMQDISPVRAAEKADAPVLLIHGKDDTVVPYDQSRNMERALRRAEKPVELITLTGEDHWLSKASTRTQMIRAAVAFVEQHNPAR